MASKPLIRGLLGRVLGCQALQPAWEKLLRLALFGMNYGGGYSTEDSGEAWVLKRFRGTVRAGSHGSPPLIFDVGANNGGYASLVRSIVGDEARLYCFEPSAAAFASLQANLGWNPNVTLLNLGLSDEEGVGNLYSNARGSVVTTMYRGSTSIADVSELTEICQLQSIDRFCAANAIGHIHLLKIDAEGGEMKVLRGAEGLIRSRSIDLIQFEFGEAQLNARTFFRDVFQLLAPEFRIYRILKAGLAPIEPYNEIREVFRTTNYLAISRRRPDVLPAFGARPGRATLKQ